MVNFAGLARLRPLMPVQTLIELAGSAWESPADDAAGRVVLSGVPGFGAQIDEAGLLGQVSFYRDFPTDLVIEGLHIGMALATAQRQLADIRANESDGSPGIEGFTAAAPDGNELRMRFKDGRLLGFDLVRPGAVYPKPKPKPKRAWPHHAKAYDLALLPHRAGRDAAGNHGWCFGLPPGLRPEQWPLDHRTGQPLRHAFTLLLPPDHRVKGRELVAVSLFGTDWCGCSVDQNEAVAAVWHVAAAPADPELRPVWLHRTSRHAHEYRMTDILDEPYAVIWLTEAEFAGPLCRPPLHPGNSQLGQPPLAAWTRIGAAAAMIGDMVSPVLNVAAEDHYAVKAMGGVPQRDLAYDVALRWTLRAQDPNAGLTPPEGWAESTPDGYQSIWHSDASGKLTLQPWAQTQAPNHIGGTMRPVQAHPQPGFSPFYVEFEEVLGGFNFGGGSAQLDLAQMRLDWACG